MYRKRGVFHFVAESHVDRSILEPEVFLNTNVMGTFKLLEASLEHTRKWQDKEFKFIHVSTDEVYGSLGFEDPAFTEQTAYDPSIGIQWPLVEGKAPLLSPKDELGVLFENAEVFEGRF